MSLEAHIRELEARHKALDLQIEEQMQHPSIDDLEIAELKREKLRLKDEIARLQAEAAAA